MGDSQQKTTAQSEQAVAKTANAIPTKNADFFVLGKQEAEKPNYGAFQNQVSESPHPNSMRANPEERQRICIPVFSILLGG